MDRPLLLAFDTSAAHCAAALLSDGQVLAEAHEAMATGQAERLFPMLEALLTEGGAGWRDLAGIGVGTGPGNFTGVRLAVAAARGLALGLGIPAVGISAFEALAWGRGDVLAVRDARLGAVHLQGFGAGAFGPVTVPLDGPLPPVPPGLAVVGDLAPEVAARCGGRAEAPLLPLAVAIGRLALERLGPDVPRPAPLYLRPADAAPAREAPPAILPG
ncbi:universal bacterial protein YeaZ [Rubellimicrobium thermophilum DSM 16684]|uniref:Universal bacterial protein YeaZ n=1 Tax=Rubellimicrobium thermophilum DSM 16684 TaxID=1123069 RepID=S9QYQ8_9RHOB|nr:tRNA (adenosine(37)-N6)-threonylcarbamoyltransferase complex dimerization subunit type 1 TsaB [Rubellimicrobium thermophilum]EPX84722.1 universal bacterial protein YeaZ [Rubellimicrobium thermophilum DSM 16684]